MGDVISELGGIRSRVSGASADAQAGWTGEAAAEAARAAAEMDGVLRRLTGSLENLRELVQMSAAGFTAAEQQQAADVRAAAAGLNDGIASR
ncbi:hypothetical protein [Streptomyces sp. NPDC127098]|uniref:hypothetical protein n=1 Tax=Streptomyces sp. NPDC127098 TaxID=3347137 RepID=UPI00365C518E